jgi:hypothetical protein
MNRFTLYKWKPRRRQALKEDLRKLAGIAIGVQRIRNDSSYEARCSRIAAPWLGEPQSARRSV